MASFLDMAGTAIIVAFLFLLGPRGLFIEFRGGVCLILAFMMLWGVFILGATVYVAVTAFAVAPDMESLAQIAERVTGNASWTSTRVAWFTPMPEEFQAYQYLMLFAGLSWG